MNSTLALARTFPPSESVGWTQTFIERTSRYWINADVGKRSGNIIELGTQQAWHWSKGCEFIRWFTDGEKRYAKALWQKASIWLKTHEVSSTFPYRKVWRFGLEVARKVKGSQGHRRWEWPRPKHPYTAVSPEPEVHANHCEALNSSIRRRCSAYRRRQNTYAKTQDGLQRAITFQRLMHNWCRPHWSLVKQNTPAMAMGYCQKIIPIEEFLRLRGFQCVNS